jgi:hypothetical protein
MVGLRPLIWGEYDVAIDYNLPVDQGCGGGELEVVGRVVPEHFGVEP